MVEASLEVSVGSAADGAVPLEDVVLERGRLIVGRRVRGELGGFEEDSLGGLGAHVERGRNGEVVVKKVVVMRS